MVAGDTRLNTGEKLYMLHSQRSVTRDRAYGRNGTVLVPLKKKSKVRSRNMGGAWVCAVCSCSDIHFDWNFAFNCKGPQRAWLCSQALALPENYMHWRTLLWGRWKNWTERHLSFALTSHFQDQPALPLTQPN